MQIPGFLRTYRGWSWLLGAASFIAPILLYALQEQTLRESTREAGESGASCGIPLLGAMMLSFLVGVLLSAMALFAGWKGYRQLTPPHDCARLIEALACGSLLLLVWMGMALLLLAALF